jgi:uncharacterized phage protein (TIGR01671 family)
MKQIEVNFRAWDKGVKGLKKPKMISFETISRSWHLHEFLNPEKYGKVIMQSTGVCDIDGQKIYEGDVLEKTKGELEGKIPDKFKKVVGNRKRVEFKDGSFVLKRSNASDSYRLSSLIIRYYGFKIIGNVFENPELLQK